jgi:plastocyanin
MRRVTVLMIALVSVCLSGPAAGAVVCARTISIDNSQYSPATAARVAQSTILVVCWDNEDGVNHTATSNRGLFDTGIIPPGMEGAGTFYGAGKYPYHCEIHAFMAGTFRVRPAVSDASITLGDSITLTVGASGVSTPSPTWDVQRRSNDGQWIQFKTATTDPSFTTEPLHSGTFRYRARTHVFGDVSGWSPARIVIVRAPSASVPMEG